MACTFSAQEHNSKIILLPLVLSTDSFFLKKGILKLFQHHPNSLAFVTSKNAVLNNKTRPYTIINFYKRYVYFLTTYLLTY